MSPPLPTTQMSLAPEPHIPLIVMYRASGKTGTDQELPFQWETWPSNPPA
jgi:hypothetical protein